MIAQLTSASPVEAPRCGRATTRSCRTSAGLGKSHTYQPRRRASSACSTAASSTTASREKLSSTAPARIWPRLSVLTRCRVAPTSGTCRVTKSAPRSTSATLPARRTCEGRLHAASTVISGSCPSTCMPSLIAASATRQPTFPRPTMPSVWPASSRPAKCFLPASTTSSIAGAAGSSAATKRSAGARLRAAINMPARTSSLTAFAFAPGALNTGTPRALKAATGMLLVPAPQRPTACTLCGNSRRCRSAERSSTACGAARSVPVR